ncbi:multidrug/spermidine efflux SMR transporter subunit MdtI [Psychromonas aquimarina]|uniref:multidrug/spermidine efflux SMR transporter subunit MdtI n=1 Tax=Psychromonas aquimarina TaxID=444919 RepID=UPI00048ECF3E|nr:multidrug/spermidine efflux SMR transporter subunit MdtI [Psychromonas aquimarina]
MDNIKLIHILFLCMSILLDIAANYFLKVSEGFKHKVPGIFAILLVAAAFISLGQAVHSIQLSIAYATWGAGGIIGTLLVDSCFFGQTIGRRCQIGVPLLISGIVVLQFSH